MELKDIIRSNSDRLFRLNNECYIIFTGDSLKDEKPFIRIGNWINMPVEIIPLVENIIVTDHIFGNPAHEQFNIDVNYLSTNRYIGSRTVVRKYLDFQKIFKLDLSSAPVVDVEKDIPTIPKENKISDRDSFIGIFYTDGNLRITHNKFTIFNLNEIENKTFHDNRIHNTISECNCDTKRYNGNGVLFIQSNPLFFKNGSFSSYHFPREYYPAFQTLDIDPLKIREIIFPSSNFINMTRFIKWKHSEKGRIKIFSDSKNEIQLLQKVYPNAEIARDNFNGFNHSTKSGLTIQNYSGTYNIKLNYKNCREDNRDLVIAYIKGIRGLQRVLKDDINGIILGSSIYEESSLLLKSVYCPILIFAESGDQTIKRIKDDRITIIYPNVHYEFISFADKKSLFDALEPLLINKTVTDMLDSGNFEGIKAYIRSLKSENTFESIRELLNISSLLKLLHSTTSERKLASGFMKLMESIDDLDKREFLTKNASSIRINLSFIDKNAVEIIESVNEAKGNGTCSFLDDIQEEDRNCISGIKQGDVKNFYLAILDDRIRLMELLKLFSDKINLTEDFIALEKAINKKKEEYHRDSLEFSESEEAAATGKLSFKSFGKPSKILTALTKKDRPIDNTKLLGEMDKTTPAGKPGLALLNKPGKVLAALTKKDHSVDSSGLLGGKDDGKSPSKTGMKSLLKPFIIVMIIIAVLFAGNRLFKSVQKKALIKKAAEEKKKAAELIERHSITVTDTDIFHYVNKIALLNGYSPIPYSRINKKDPNWIFPGNIFSMPDGDKINVRQGDTLWQISTRKLMRKQVEFYNIIESIENKIERGKDISKDITRARELAFNKKHYKKLNDLEQRSNRPGK